MKPRTRARSIALQVLYEIDLVNHPLGEALKYRLEDSPIDERLIGFVKSIVQGVWSMYQQLDGYIAEHAPEWPLDQVATIDRNILRIALWEFAVNAETPLKVAINEAVELAKVFGSDSSPRFINGVLGSLATNQNEIRQALNNLGSSTEK
jgi:N utilization substance protein B